ncbi:hypothetical protein L21SP5_00448 [Salinivirga cyanobacteriivorans]|uniref:Uncharacterized protein n=1 Tax=Salinivirga cyanobacteriivorans TaxID=1307839 RepID=A0A0S2HVQ2_9BACT|nr:hypothetical protein L21SP5_00448 [Salinivirga cyanobacteriivorans]
MTQNVNFFTRNQLIFRHDLLGRRHGAQNRKGNPRIFSGGFSLGNFIYIPALMGLFHLKQQVS